MSEPNNYHHRRYRNDDRPKTGSESDTIRTNKMENVWKHVSTWFTPSRPETNRPVRLEHTWQDIVFIHSIPVGEDRNEGLIVLADGTFRKIIRCRGINALLFDGAERDQLGLHLTNLANSIEFDLQIVVTSRNLPVDDYLSRYQSQINTQDEYLRWYAQYTDTWFRRMQELHFIPQRDFYVVVSFNPPDCRNLGTTGWDGRRSIKRHNNYSHKLNRNVRLVMNQLTLSGLQPEVLNREEVRDLIYRHLNPKLSDADVKAPPSAPGVTEASMLARSALKVRDEHIWLDGKYIGSQYLQSPPHETWFGWLVDLLTLNAEYTLSMFLHVCDQDEVRKTLQGEYNISIIANNELSGAPDLGTVQHALDTRNAIQQFLRSSDKAVDLSLYIKTQADKIEELEERMDEISRVFKNRGAYLDRGQCLQLDAWQSCLPVGVDKLAAVRRLMTPVAGSFWPFFTAACGTPDGVPIGFAVASREPVLLNPFYMGEGKDAHNMFVVGTTGAGKSFAVLMMILRLLPLGMRFVIIDKTVDKFGAYRFITELLGRELCVYVDLGPGSGLILNPFDLGPEDDGIMGKPSPLKITKLLGLLDLMLVPEGREELDVEEKSLLDGLIRETYRQTALKGMVPTMSDLANVTSLAASQETDPLQRDRLKQFARGLSLFTRESTFGGLVDGYTNIDTTRMVIVFDTRDVNDPRLERIMTYILTEFIRKRAGESKIEGVRMAAIIDEAATLMRFTAGARLLEDLSRRARHYGLMLVTITQQLKDFFRQSEIASAVVKNAHMKVLLRQDPSDLAMLQTTLQLTDAERQAVAAFGSAQKARKDSQALLIVGASRGTIRIVPSPMDYWICTSEPTKDIPKRQKIIKQLQTEQPKMNHSTACRQAVFQLGAESKI